MAPNKNTRKGRGRGNKPPTGESSAGATSTAPSSQHQLLQDAVSSVTSHATATASSTGTDDQSMLAMINSVMPDILPATREVAGGHYSFCGCTPKLQQAVNEDPVLHDVFATMTYLAKESYTSQECDQMLHRQEEEPDKSDNTSRLALKGLLMFRSKREQKSEASLPEVFDVGLYHALMSALSVQVDDSETSTMPEDGVVSESFQRSMVEHGKALMAAKQTVSHVNGENRGKGKQSSQTETAS